LPATAYLLILEIWLGGLDSHFVPQAMSLETREMIISIY